LAKYNSILLVDDDPDDKELFFEALGQINRTVDCRYAHDGEEALHMLGDGLQPDIVFLDLNMPRLDGKEFLRRVASLRSFQQMPVVVYSTSSQQKDKQEALALGATDYIVKPSNQSDLYSVISKYFHPTAA
jgi:CheY-like chemotaxis protein